MPSKDKIRTPPPEDVPDVEMLLPLEMLPTVAIVTESPLVELVALICPRLVVEELVDNRGAIRKESPPVSTVKLLEIEEYPCGLNMGLVAFRADGVNETVELLRVVTLVV